MLIMKKRCPHLRTKSLTRLHRTSDDKHSRKLPAILTSLNVYEDDIIKKTRKKFSGWVRLHRTSDEKHSRNRPIILTSLIVYVDYIIMKKIT